MRSRARSTAVEWPLRAQGPPDAWAELLYRAMWMLNEVVVHPSFGMGGVG